MLIFSRLLKTLCALAAYPVTLHERVKENPCKDDVQNPGSQHIVIKIYKQPQYYDGRS